MKKIIFALAVLVILSGCGPGREPVESSCNLGRHMKCTGFDHDGEGFILDVENTMNADIEEIRIKIDKCGDALFLGSIPNGGKKSLGIPCPGAEGVFKSTILANYEMLGTQYDSIGSITADMDYKNFRKNN